MLAFAELRGIAVSFSPSDAPLCPMIGFAAGFDEETIRAQALAEPMSPFNPVMENLPMRVAGAAAEVVPRHELRKTLYYNDFLKIHDINDTMSAMDRTSKRGVGVLTGVTGGSRVIDDRHLSLLRAVAPHLFQVIDLQRQFASLELVTGAARDVLCRAHFGCALLGRDGSVWWMNPLAESIVTGGEALALRGEQLEPTSAVGRLVFTRAVRAALALSAGLYASPSPCFTLPKRDGGAPLELIVSPLRRRWSGLQELETGAMVIMCDPDHVDERFSTRLQGMFGLTEAEAEVAQWILSGHSPPEIAEIFGRSISTVRSHLKAIFAKTGCRSQGEMVATFQRSLARLQ